MAGLKNSQHVMKSKSGGWNVKRGGSQKATKHFDTQHDAIDWGRRLARSQKVLFYIHGEDGKIRIKNNYKLDS